MGQSGLGDFSADREDRPDAEAVAVAGTDGGGAAAVASGPLEFPEAAGTLELAVTQVDYTLDSSGGSERPVVHVFGRTADDEHEHVRVHGFRPYFYVPTGSVDPDELDRIDGITGWEETDADGEAYRSIRGERLTKVFGRTPRDVGEVRERFDHYEADILFPNRFLIDHGIKSGLRVPERRDGAGVVDVPHGEVEPADVSASLRVNTFDIEVDDRRGFPEDGEEAILCISSHDSYRDEYTTWLAVSSAYDGEVPARLTDHEMLEGDGTVGVRAFDSEARMLEAFLDYLETTDPDVLTGWNFADFDAPYLIARLKRLEPATDADLDYNRLSRVGEVWESDWQGPNVKGRVVFDLLYGYQRTQFSELDSYRLDAVGEQELGVGKERYTGDIGDLWETDPERLLEYNLRDVELCVEIDRRQAVIAFWEEVASFVGCKLEDATTPGDAVDMYVLHKAHGQFALPSKGQQEGEEFEGGAVFDPITGVREMVAVLDLASLYPMAMVTLNASPETKVGDDYDGPTTVAPNGQRFRAEPDGMMREMIDELLAEREEKKDRRDEHDPGTEAYGRFDRQQAAVKVIMNCFTPDTEVLTPGGVRTITDLEVGDPVYSLEPESMRLEVKPVVETHAYPDYRGELVDFRTDEVDLRVTPNHRMLVRKNERNGVTEDAYGFVEAGELYDNCNYELPHGWSMDGGEPLGRVDITELIDGDYEVWVRPSVHGHTFRTELGWTPRRVPKADLGQTGYVLTAEEFEAHRDYVESVCEHSYVHREPGRKWVPRTYDGDDFLQLLAWYVTEGNVYTSADRTFGEHFRGSSTTVKIAQNERAVTDGGTDGHASIGGLLDRMGLDCYTDERGHTFTSRLLGEFLREACGAGSAEKRIPDLVWDLDADGKRLFLETLIEGDGDRTGPTSWRYTTSSERLRDDVLRLCAHLGLTPSYNHDSGSWRVYCTEGGKNTLRPYRSAQRSTATDGVYCVTVADNHTLLAGRNGKFQFVGQSLYGVSGWERFRLYDRESAAAVTATGREVIEFTADAAAELDKEVIYGDTDSVMLELEGELESIEAEVEVPESMREAHPEMDDEELREVALAIDVSFDIEDHINSRYDAFARDELDAEFHRFEIEFEKLYRRFFQAGKKKRYAGHIVWKEGKDVDDIDITGFEYKRSDIAPITKRVQRRVIEMIVRGDDLDDVAAYVAGVIEEFREGRVSLDEIGIPGGIGKRLGEYEADTAQVRGARYANLFFGTNFGRGSKPKRLYLEGVHPSFFETFEADHPELFGGDNGGLADDSALDREQRRRKRLYREFKTEQDVVCFEFADQIPEAFDVDYDKMLDRTLKGPIARVLEAVGVSWEEVRSGQQQTGLGQYM